MISEYAGTVPRGDLLLLQRLCERFSGRSFLNINSTRTGGGVAEILQRMVPILNSLGVDVRWEVIAGDSAFFDVTKKMHNGLQGAVDQITDDMWAHYVETSRTNAETLDLNADAVLIHDPQPAPLIEFKKGGKWIWRCHIDVASPQHAIFNTLRRYISRYDAAVFSVPKFARAVGIDEFIITPSIDPLSEKNRELTRAEIDETLQQLGVESDRPIILQVSRFDRFKDPVGVIRAFRMVKKYNDCVLILAGGSATDDPEGEIVLNEVKEHAASDPDIRILLLPPFSDRAINALQRAATVIVQKSLKEGFGLTVSEGMWKGKPVIGGAVGGIPVQILHGMTGFLVYSDEGAAFRIRQLLNNPEMARAMGEAGREYVRNNFLITRQIRDYLSVWYALENPGKHVLEL